MPDDEVTKRDLQSLQANVNRQIADLNKQIADLNKRFDDNKKSFDKDLDEVNQITVNVNKDLTKRMDGFQDAINALGRAIGDVANKQKG